MGKVTALEPQKRNKERVNVYLDGQFAFGLAAEAATSLRIGQELDEAAIEALQDEDAIARAKQSAFRFLSYRLRSIQEVRQNLLGKGFNETLVEGIIEYLCQHQYLDDEKFAEYWIEQRETFKPRSRLALRQELFEKGVPRAVINKALEDVDEEEAAAQAALKQAARWRHLSQDEFQQKLIGYLRRRGFSYGISRTTTERMWQQRNVDDMPPERR